MDSISAGGENDDPQLKMYNEFQAQMTKLLEDAPEFQRGTNEDD